jgi:hypothetical protein
VATKKCGWQREARVHRKIRLVGWYAEDVEMTGQHHVVGAEAALAVFHRAPGTATCGFFPWIGLHLLPGVN